MRRRGEARGDGRRSALRRLTPKILGLLLNDWRRPNAPILQVPLRRPRTLFYSIDSARNGAIADVAANHLIVCVGSPKRSHYQIVVVGTTTTMLFISS